jgi:ABC-type antimicrobial peptide transport system permease subunit
VAGRWFLPGEIKKKGSAIVVNESTVKTLGYKNPADAVGKKISIGINDYTPIIVGITKDFHTKSLHEVIKPVALMPFPVWYYATAIRINPSDIKNSLSKIETAWRKVYPDDVYKFKFIDEALAERYEQEQTDYILFKSFSLISIFICCIGLWGLIAFVVIRKTKEIGIRKVLGATVSSIVTLLSKDFIKLVLIALVVASPLAWYFMNRWLENFAYRIDISWWVFALAGGIAVIIALTTISLQSIKAAIANPVKSLRID